MSPQFSLEFPLGGHNYRVRKMSAMAQWHLNRKVAPLLPPLVPIMIRLAKSGGFKGDLSLIGELLGPFADGIASMSDESSEYVLNTCMASVQREVAPGTWQNVWTQGGISPFPELNDLSSVIPIVVKVIWDALGPFIKGLLTAQESGGSERTTPTP